MDGQRQASGDSISGQVHASESACAAESGEICSTVSAAIACVELKLRGATAVLEQCPVGNHAELEAAARCVCTLSETLDSLLKLQQRCGRSS